MERKQQLERSLATTIENGNFVTESNPVKIFFRDWYLWLVQLVPSWRHALHLGNRREGMVQYKYAAGMPFLPQYGGGKSLPQVYCRKLGQSMGDVAFTDDVIWDVAKPALFRLVVLLRSLGDLPSALNATADLESIFAVCGLAVVITIILEDVTLSATDFKFEKPWSANIYRVATGDEFARSPLCKNRPAPYGYDPHRLGKEVCHKRFIFLRPDRIVFAACDRKDEVNDVAQHIASFMSDYGPDVATTA